jgi:hypothetical protein
LSQAPRAALTGERLDVIHQDEIWREHSYFAIETIDVRLSKGGRPVHSREGGVDCWSALDTISERIEEKRIVGEEC